jgi:MFS transporter, CP family, cyanate transporter
MDAISDSADRQPGRFGATPAHATGATPSPRSASRWVVAGVLLIAFNICPSITTVAMFIGDIQRDLGLSAFAISVLTMTPVVCIGLFAPTAPPLARRFGVEAVLFLSLVGVALGSVVRSLGVAPLYLGTVIIGASLCFLGVLTPVIVKRDFPHRVGLMMGLYTMLVCTGPALATATAVPLQRTLGGSWEAVLLIWGLIPLIGAAAFIPVLLRRERTAAVESADSLALVRDPLAWQVTGYFGLITSLAYTIFNWGPSMLEARGLDAATSGLVLSLCYVAQTASGLLAPLIAGRQRDQRLAIAVVVVVTAIGFLGFAFAPVWSLAGVSVVLGLGQGGTFGIALLLFVLRARDPHGAAQLSALAQSVGYIFGGLVGPFAVGMLYAGTGSWKTVSIFILAVGFASLVLGMGAGRTRMVRASAAALVATD